MKHFVIGWTGDGRIQCRIYADGQCIERKYYSADRAEWLCARLAEEGLIGDGEQLPDIGASPVAPKPKRTPTGQARGFERPAKWWKRAV